MKDGIDRAIVYVGKPPHDQLDRGIEVMYFRTGNAEEININFLVFNCSDRGSVSHRGRLDRATIYWPAD